MAGITSLISLGMPLALAASGVVAWRMSKHESTKPDQPGWRDDSLDEWRQERDRQAEAERAARPLEKTHLSTGSEEQQETKKHHQRLGG